MSRILRQRVPHPRGERRVVQRDAERVPELLEGVHRTARHARPLLRYGGRRGARDAGGDQPRTASRVTDLSGQHT
ncbi:hypothetical protein ACX28Y_08375 [Streptomyces sp. SD35]